MRSELEGCTELSCGSVTRLRIVACARVYRYAVRCRWRARTSDVIGCPNFDNVDVQCPDDYPKTITSDCRGRALIWRDDIGRLFATDRTRTDWCP